MKRVFEAIMLLVGTLGWWGFVYPDLCLTEDTYKQEYEEYEKYEDYEDYEANERLEERQAEGGKVTEALKLFPDAEIDSKKEKYNKKEAVTEENKGKPAISPGKIRIKSRFMEYVYQSG